MQVQSLIGELRCHMVHTPKKQNIKQKQSCDKLNENCSNDPHSKKKKKVSKNNKKRIFPITEVFLWGWGLKKQGQEQEVSRELVMSILTSCLKSFAICMNFFLKERK